VVLYRSIFDVVRDFLNDEAIEGQEKVMDRGASLHDAERR
jgi:hypothetical protein